MRGLVDHQAAGFFFLAVPAAEIIGAVMCVEQPVKVDRLHVANLAAHQDVLHLRARRGIAVVEGHPAIAAGAAARVDDRLTGLGGRGHRLLGDDIAAELHRADDELVMKGIARRHDHLVRLRLGDHAVKIRGRITRRNLGAIGFGALARNFHAARVGIAQGHQLGGGRILDLDRVLVQFMARAGSDDGVAPPAVSFRRLRAARTGRKR